jgi:hypothetical protein
LLASGGWLLAGMIELTEMGPDRKCAKCSGEMEIGFLRDRAGPGRFKRISGTVEWFAGLPQPSSDGSIKTRSKTRFRIDVFRCKNCGYLEHYASKPLLAEPTSY